MESLKKDFEKNSAKDSAKDFMIKGMIFDLDGTLVDSLSATIEAFNHGIEAQGGKRLTAEAILSYFGPGEGEIFARILGPEKAEGACQAAKNFMDAHLAEIPLHAGISELLDQLQKNNIPISIFTGRSWATTEMILNHHQLMDRFVAVVASDHVSSPKPSPEGLHLALSKMKLETYEVLFIGDSHLDIIASQSAGVKGVAALWDLMAQRKQLEPYHPHHWAHTPQDIWTLWEESHKTPRRT